MAAKPLQTVSTTNPQQVFESALSIMKETGRRGRRIAARSLPIAPVQSEQQVEKRAITDAARALATLWKVSPHLVR